MNRQWLWKPVILGAIIFALLGCLFITFIIVVLTCPGIQSGCLTTRQTIIPDLLTFGWPPTLIGGAIGAALGAIYAVIRRRIKKGRETALRHN